MIHSLSHPPEFAQFGRPSLLKVLGTIILAHFDSRLFPATFAILSLLRQPLCIQVTALCIHDVIVLFTMKLRGSLLVIVCCFVIEFCNFTRKEYLVFLSGDSLYAISFLTIVSLLFLLYPLMGHLTDVKLLIIYHNPNIVLSLFQSLAAAPPPALPPSTSPPPASDDKLDNQSKQLVNPRRMREGYGTCFVIRSFVHSFIRSVHRAAETIAHF